MSDTRAYVSGPHSWSIETDGIPVGEVSRIAGKVLATHDKGATVVVFGDMATAMRYLRDAWSVRAGSGEAVEGILR